MKKINYQCPYTVDDTKYPYTAFNNDGQLMGFVNLPVRNYEIREWVDSVTGETGEIISYDYWETSMRITAEMCDCMKKFEHKHKAAKPSTLYGKKYKTFKRSETE